jgi:hypothetical protein
MRKEKALVTILIFLLITACTSIIFIGSSSNRVRVDKDIDTHVKIDTNGSKADSLPPIHGDKAF